jgi:hypothetical protein
VDWVPRSSGTSQDLNGVAYGDGLFVVQGLGGVIRTSTDGFTWTPRSSGTTDGLATSAYAFDHFVIVGLNGKILTSTNGVEWVRRTSGTTALLIGVLAAPDSFVVVGEGGTILQSDPFAPLAGGRFEEMAYSPLTGFRFTFSEGSIGQPYRVQSAPTPGTDGWTDFTNFTYTGPVVITDSSAGSGSNRTFRAVTP